MKDGSINRDALSARRKAAIKVLLNGKTTVIPMHAKKELGKGLVLSIKEDLGLKE
jgi:predicted RNA binding protein YcfA (HicA-like mRNA interferase family)